MLEWVVAGTRWRVGVPFLSLLAAALTLDQSGTAAMCILASFLHESGHIAALLLWGRFPREVTVGLCGIRLVPDGRPLGYRREALMLLAGPAVNLLLVAFLIAVNGRIEAIAAHLVLGVFNLLPVEALDGGQALRCLLLLRMSDQKASRVVRVVSIICLLPLATAGFWLLLQSGNGTLLAVSLYLILRLFSHQRI
jgi:stage IV sporulation protein FB